METGMIKWEREVIDRISYARRKQSIWLTADTRNKEKYVKMSISADIVNEAGWKSGDTVWLYTSGNMFMLKREKSDFMLRANDGHHIDNGYVGTLSLTSQDFVAHLRPFKNGSEFDAWVDDGNVIFKSKKKEA